MNALVIELDENFRPLHPMRTQLVRDGKVLAELTTAKEFEQLLKTSSDLPLSRWPAAPTEQAPLINLGGQGRIGHLDERQATAAMRIPVIALIVMVVIVAGFWLWSIRGAFG